MILPMNYTQVSNEFMARLPELTGEEVKIFLAISRKTIGWHKTSDRIPYSQLKTMTGIRHHVTIKKAALHLVELGLIAMSGDDTVGYTYDLAMSSDDTLSMSRRDTSKETTQNKQDSAPTERAAPSGTAGAPVPFPIATIREEVAKEECPPQVAPDINVGTKALEDRLWAKFLARQPDQRFPTTTYAKERKGVKRLVAEAFARQPEAPERWLGGYLEAWARLKRDRRSLIYSQPNTPAAMSSGALMQRVIDEMAQAVLIPDDGPLIPWGRV